MDGPSQFPLALPTSYSVAPPPLPTERTLVAIHRVIQTQPFKSKDEINLFMNSQAGRQAIDAEEKEPHGTWARAQSLAYDAWEAERPRRYALARDALQVDPRCSDAWLILAEEERSWRKQKRLFERAVAAAEQACADEGWMVAPRDGGQAELVGNGTRPYLRAHMALARCLMDGGYYAEAAVHFETVLRLDEHDRMGARYEVLQAYHMSDDRAALRTLLAHRCREDDAILLYERLWLALADGETAAVNDLERAAAEANPHVLRYLTGQEEPPADGIDYMSPGGEDEAAAYFGMAVRWWLDNENSLAWLRAKAAESGGRS